MKQKGNFIKKNILTITMILIVSLLFFLAYEFFSKREAFTTSPNSSKKLDPNTTTNNLTYKATTWTPETVYNYLLTQKTSNENVIYDPIILQQNATQEEADFFLKNGFWKWSNETKDNYINILQKNKIIRTYPEQSLNIDQTIYPEKTIQEILAFNTPEGKFVLEDTVINEEQNQKRASDKGMGIFGFTSGLLNPESNQTIGCRKLPGDQTDEPYLFVPNKNKGEYSQVLPKYKKLDYAQLPELVDGFTFTNGPCNPCTLLNQPPDYSCKFKVKSTF
jgi:hypothetical protein